MTWSVLLLAFAPLDLGEQEAAGVRARLRVAVPGEGAGPGLARVRLEMDVAGPAGLEAEFPRLDDAAWRVGRAGSSWRPDGEVRVALWLELVQTRPGPAELPSVALRVRPGPKAGWEELIWPDPLQGLKGVPDIESPPPPAEAGTWPWLLVLLAGCAGLALLPLFWRGPARLPQATPRQRALEALASISGPGGFDAAEAALRRFLAEEHSVPPARTAAELEKEWPAFAAVFRLCERARFSGAPAPQERLEEALRMARVAIAEGGQDGEPGKTASSG